MDPVNNIVPAYVGKPVLCDNASSEAWRSRKLVTIDRQEVLDICVESTDGEEDGIVSTTEVQPETTITTTSAATTTATTMAMLGCVASSVVLLTSH